MKSIIRKLKNWWFAIVGIALIILDQGFEVLNPLLTEIGIPAKVISILKLVFGIYGIYKLKMQMPTLKKENLVTNEIDDNIAGGGPRPPKKT